MNPDEYTKQEAIAEIARVVGAQPAELTSRGGTGTTAALTRLAETLGLTLGSTQKQAMAGEIAAAANLPWLPEWSSRGGTITARGWAQVLLASQVLSDSPHISARPARLGVAYEPSIPATGHDGTLHTIDMQALDRGTRAHSELERRIAAAVAEAGGEPRSPTPGEPAYDLAWERSDDVVVCEVKSATPGSVRQQVRLGLGQLLEYRHQLSALHDRPVVGVLAVGADLGRLERGVCASVAVVAASAATLDSDLREVLTV